MKQLETPVNHGQTISNDPISTLDIKLLTSLKDVTDDNIIDESIGIAMNLILTVMKNLWLHARDAQLTLKCLSWRIGFFKFDKQKIYINVPLYILNNKMQYSLSFPL